ncbi:hypothetical protein FRB97_000365 [Tulasnella sp. 331]|nr:hypothetical protein FRB97_000365 [Tulasnella sp. 331]
MTLEAPKPIIAVIGSLNYDLVSVVSRFPNPGETLTSESFSTNPGGKGANQAVAAGRIAKVSVSGLDVVMIGAVGNDGYGSELIQGLKNHGVGTKDVKMVDGGVNTGVAVIIVEKDTGENRIMIDPGANKTVVPYAIPHSAEECIPNHLFQPTTRPDLIVMQLEIPLDTVMKTIDHAATASIPVPVLLNPAPAQELPPGVYPKVELLVVNETEAAILSGVDFFPSHIDSQKEDEVVLLKAREALAWFVQRGQGML